MQSGDVTIAKVAFINDAGNNSLAMAVCGRGIELARTPLVTVAVSVLATFNHPLVWHSQDPLAPTMTRF